LDLSKIIKKAVEMLQPDQILEMEEEDKIRLGKVRPGVHQQDRLNREHEKAMAGQEVKTNKYGSGIDIQSHHKESADPFPHQCRFYRGCTEINSGNNQILLLLNNATENQVHFSEKHPLTVDEEHFYLTIHRNTQPNAPRAKSVHELSILYGRSEDTVRGILSKNGVPKSPKWGKRGKEINDFHQQIKANRAAIIHEYSNIVEQQTLFDADTTFDIPIDVGSIQGQNYISGEQTDALTQMEGALTFGTQLVEQCKALRAWKVEAEERETAYQERIKTLQEYAQNLDKLVVQFTEGYNKAIQSDDIPSDLNDVVSLSSEDSPPTL